MAVEVRVNEKRDGGRQKRRRPSSSARTGGKSFVAARRARSTVLVSGDPSCFHLDYSHFLKFLKQQREECVCLQVTFQPSLSVFEPELPSLGARTNGRRRLHQLNPSSAAAAYILRGT